MSKEFLSVTQVKTAIEKGGYIPQTIGLWIDPSVYEERSAEVSSIKDNHPIDFTMLIPTFPGYAKSPFDEYPSYVWGKQVSSSSKAIDSQQLIDDWDELDDFIANMPKYSFEPITNAAVKEAAEDKTGRYRLCHFWYFLYERLWSFRGMENALIDMHTNPNEIKRLFEALCEFYIGVIDRVHTEIGCDGVYVTDDMGTQLNLMFSPAMFRELFLPYYKKVVDECHKRGLHFWLHSCGNIESILPDLIDIGVDVIHPIQKFTMDEAAIAAKYKEQICFMCGMDVQQTMPFGTPDDVRSEVKRLIHTFAGDGGRMIFSMGNGVTPNIPIENIEALYDEVYRFR